MTKVPETRNVALPPHVRLALEDGPEDASLIERAATAWGAEHQSLAGRATISLLKRIRAAFGVDVEVFNSEWFDRSNPVECAGAKVEDVVFALRGQIGGETLSVIVPCDQKDCDQELWGPVDGIVSLGRVLALIEEQKTDGKPWRCPQHRKGAPV